MPTPDQTAPLRVEIHLRLPAPAAVGEPLKLAGLKTDLPRFAHRLHNLTGSVAFAHVRLETRDAPIAADVGADELVLRTKNAPVEGALGAAYMLAVETTNAPIRARVHLVNDLAVLHSTTSAFLWTTNGCGSPLFSGSPPLTLPRSPQ